AHGDQERTDALHHVSSLECRDAASRESEIDGAPALALCEPRVGPAIVDIDRESTACEEHGEQRAREAAAYDVDRLLGVGFHVTAQRLGEWRHGSRRKACASASAP